MTTWETFLRLSCPLVIVLTVMQSTADIGYVHNRIPQIPDPKQPVKIPTHVRHSQLTQLSGEWDLVPETIKLGGQEFPVDDTLWDSRIGAPTIKFSETDKNRRYDLTIRVLHDIWSSIQITDIAWKTSHTGQTNLHGFGFRNSMLKELELGLTELLRNPDLVILDEEEGTRKRYITVYKGDSEASFVRRPIPALAPDTPQWGHSCPNGPLCQQKTAEANYNKLTPIAPP